MAFTAISCYSLQISIISNKSVNEKTIVRKKLLFITGLPDRILNHVLRLSLRRDDFSTYVAAKQQFAAQTERFESAKQTKKQRRYDVPTLFFGLPDRILNHVLRLSLRRAIFPPTLPQNNSMPRKLRGSICGQAKPKKSDTTVSLFLCFGLPDRIRTCGLKSRSLARYPAAPRADVPLA